jgi:hypothetical protein
MTNHSRCLCGYQAISDDDLSDHLAEAFTPDGDRGSDGVAHAELSRPRSDGTVWECLCGLTTIELASLDAHLASVFTPRDRTGRDGARHAPLRPGPACAGRIGQPLSGNRHQPARPARLAGARWP